MSTDKYELSGLGSTDLPSHWQVRRLGTLIAQKHRYVQVSDDGEYKLLGVRWYGWGAFHRETVTSETSEAKVLQPVDSGELIYNRLFAWKGSFAIVPESLAGTHVSNEFPLFDARPDCDIRYIRHYLCQPGLWRYIADMSTGATKTSRNRLREARLRDFRVPCPPLVEQSEIADYLDPIAASTARVIDDIGVEQVPTRGSLASYIIEERDAKITQAVLGRAS